MLKVVSTTLNHQYTKDSWFFFQNVNQDCRDNPESPVSVVLRQAIDQNTQFLRHYIKLERTFTSPQQWFDQHINEQKQQTELKIHEKFESDPDSILGTYLRVNPDLKVPEFNNNISCHELDRKTITRYRTGCHKLKIQMGRLAGDGRDTRLCSCEHDVQTLAHVLFSCPLTEVIRQVQGMQSTCLEQFFKDTDFLKSATILKAIAKQLKL